MSKKDYCYGIARLDSSVQFFAELHITHTDRQTHRFVCVCVCMCMVVVRRDNLVYHKIAPRRGSVPISHRMSSAPIFALSPLFCLQLSSPSSPSSPSSKPWHPRSPGGPHSRRRMSFASFEHTHTHTHTFHDFQSLFFLQQPILRLDSWIEFKTIFEIVFDWNDRTSICEARNDQHRLKHKIKSRKETLSNSFFFHYLKYLKASIKKEKLK